MGGEIPTLPAEVPELQRLVIRLQEELSFVTSRATVLEEELTLLRTKIFGRRSERFTEEELRQSSLFDEAESATEASPTAEQSEAGTEWNPSPFVTHPVK
jgi:Transposase C of IS166 homeodomain